MLAHCSTRQVANGSEPGSLQSEQVSECHHTDDSVSGPAHINHLPGVGRVDITAAIHIEEKALFSKREATAFVTRFFPEEIRCSLQIGNRCFSFERYRSSQLAQIGFEKVDTLVGKEVVVLRVNGGHDVLFSAHVNH